MSFSGNITIPAFGSGGIEYLYYLGQDSPNAAGSPTFFNVPVPRYAVFSGQQFQDIAASIVNANGNPFLPNATLSVDFLINGTLVMTLLFSAGDPSGTTRFSNTPLFTTGAPPVSLVVRVRVDIAGANPSDATYFISGSIGMP